MSLKWDDNEEKDCILWDSSVNRLVEKKTTLTLHALCKTNTTQIYQEKHSEEQEKSTIETIIQNVNVFLVFQSLTLLLFFPSPFGHAFSSDWYAKLEHFSIFYSRQFARICQPFFSLLQFSVVFFFVTAPIPHCFGVYNISVVSNFQFD